MNNNALKLSILLKHHDNEIHEYLTQFKQHDYLPRFIKTRSRDPAYLTGRQVFCIFAIVTITIITLSLIVHPAFLALFALPGIPLSICVLGDFFDGQVRINTRNSCLCSNMYDDIAPSKCVPPLSLFDIQAIIETEILKKENELIATAPVEDVEQVLLED